MSTKEIAKNLVCIIIRGGIEVWTDEANIDVINLAMEKKDICRIGKNVINGADIQGVFDAKTMDERNRRKNGQYQCWYGFWHEKFDQCGHRSSKG